MERKPSIMLQCQIFQEPHCKHAEKEHLFILIRKTPSIMLQYQIFQEPHYKNTQKKNIPSSNSNETQSKKERGDRKGKKRRNFVETQLQTHKKEQFLHLNTKNPNHIQLNFSQKRKAKTTKKLKKAEFRKPLGKL